MWQRIFVLIVMFSLVMAPLAVNAAEEKKNDFSLDIKVGSYSHWLNDCGGGIRHPAFSVEGVIAYRGYFADVFRVRGIEDSYPGGEFDFAAGWHGFIDANETWILDARVTYLTFDSSAKNEVQPQIVISKVVKTAYGNFIPGAKFQYWHEIGSDVWGVTPYPMLGYRLELSDRLELGVNLFGSFPYSSPGGWTALANGDMMLIYKILPGMTVTPGFSARGLLEKPASSQAKTDYSGWVTLNCHF